MVCEKILKIDFQDGHPIGTSLAFSDLEVIFLLQCQLQLKPPNGLEGGPKLVFKMASMEGYFGFPIGMILAIFLSTHQPDTTS